MNREQIIRITREAEHLVIEDYYTNGPVRAFSEAQLERFAALVASAEREFYMQLFLDPENQPTQFGTATQEYREQEVREAKQQERHEFKEHALAMARAAIIGAVKNEREACAEICKKHADVYEKLEGNPTAQSAWAACIDNRDAIRARGQA